jgi:putative ABC transport system permease protein
MSRLAVDIARAHTANAGEGVLLSTFRDERVGDVRVALLLLMGAAVFILLITCTNVANLLLARASARATEMSVRSALGASRGRLARQLIVESALLAAAGTVAGLGLTIWLKDLLVAMFPANIANLSIPQLQTVPIDGRVLIFTVALSVLTTLSFGLAPAIRAGRSTLNQRVPAAPSRQMRRVLIVAEAALTLVLLAGAGLMLRSFLHVIDADLGFEPRQAMAVQVTLPASRYPNADRQRAFVDAVVARIQQLPGVEAAGATNFLPLSGFWGVTSVLAEGMPNPPPGQEISADYRVATPDYFRSMGIRFVQGRPFAPGDRADGPAVAIINQSLARRFWPDAEAVGRRVNLGSVEKPDFIEVVGVIADVKSFGQEEATHLDVYRPYAQAPFGLVAFTVRTGTAASSMLPTIRRQIWAEDPELPMFRENTMEQLAGESTALRRVSLQLLAGFALLALLLAAVGTYGVMSYVVSQRLPEIGVRMALGARRSAILSMVLGEVGRTAVAGLLLGIGAALAVTRTASSLLVGVTAADPGVFAASSMMLLLVVAVAGYLPARRASRIDPLAVLRRD